jgi:hypothetical protein
MPWTGWGHRLFAVVSRDNTLCQLLAPRLVARGRCTHQCILRRSWHPIEPFPLRPCRSRTAGVRTVMCIAGRCS